MNRQQIIRKQILAGAVVLVVLLIVVGIHESLLTFDHQVPLGKLVSAQLASSSGTCRPSRIRPRWPRLTPPCRTTSRAPASFPTSTSTPAWT